MFRAGLVSIILLFLYITLASSAPLPGRQPSDIHSFDTRSGNLDHELAIRSLEFDLLNGRDLPSLQKRDFDIADGNYYTREVTARAESLYRRGRSSIGQKIKGGFRGAAVTMKNAVAGLMSARIYASLGKKLGKGMGALAKPVKNMGYVP